MVEVGEAKIVGQVFEGKLMFEPGEDPNGAYLVMTKKTYIVLMSLAYKVEALELKVKQLEAKQK